MNIHQRQLLITQETPPPPVEPPPEIEAPEIPDTGDLGKKEDVPCPGPSNLRVGDITQSGDERVVGVKVKDDGKVCETLYTRPSHTCRKKYLPSLQIKQPPQLCALQLMLQQQVQQQHHY